MRIGTGAGYSGDRIDPAVVLAKNGNLDYLIFECLAERTIALAQLAKLRDASSGYDPLLRERMCQVLPHAVRSGTRIVTNMGAANPLAAAEEVVDVAQNLGIRGLRVAAVIGDDVFDQISKGNASVLETGEPISAYKDRAVSANAYLGAEGILTALKEGALVVITGRVSDPSLFLAPMIHELGWSLNDFELLGRGTVIGHLLECAGQITGGYFADPNTKPVPGLADLGFPLAEIDASGEAVITKLPGTGGMITLQTCKEQLLYEVGNPAEYFTPDVVADFSGVALRQLGSDRVRVAGGTGKRRPETLKVGVGYRDGFRGEGEVSYSGPSASKRAHLAGKVVNERLRTVHGLRPLETRTDFIGENATFRGVPPVAHEAFDVRLRIAAKTHTREEAELVGREVEALLVNGPAGGGGARKYVDEIVGMVSILIPRGQVTTQLHMFES